MAEMDTYHTQKVEDFQGLAKEHLDGEIAFYEQVRGHNVGRVVPPLYGRHRRHVENRQTAQSCRRLATIFPSLLRCFGKSCSFLRTLYVLSEHRLTIPADPQSPTNSAESLRPAAVRRARSGSAAAVDIRARAGAPSTDSCAAATTVSTCLRLGPHATCQRCYTGGCGHASGCARAF